MATEATEACWCGETAEYLNPASDATPAVAVCHRHTADGYADLAAHLADERAAHLAAVERALAKRGLTLAEYRAELAAKRAAASETASDAEAAHLRRLPAAKLLTVAHDGQVRRGQWVEMTAEILATTRRRCQGLLPWHDAEDLAADTVKRELDAGIEAGRPGCVRAERLTATYLSLTARQHRATLADARLSELTEDAESAADLLAAEDITPLDLAADADADADDVWQVWRTCKLACERLCLPATLPIVASLAQSIEDRPAAALAADWGIGAAVWKRDAAIGTREIRASYPDGRDLLARLVPDHNFTVRATPIADRKIGDSIPAESRRRTLGAMAREANVLLARPALPGRAPKASKRTSGAWRAVAPGDWSANRAPMPTDPAVSDARKLAAKLAATQPRHGARPHRAAPGVKAGAMASTAPAAPERDRTLAMFRSLASTARLTQHRATGSPAEVLANLAALEDLAARTVAAMARTAPVGRQLVTWQPGSLTAARTAPHSTSHVLAAARVSMANLATAEATAAPSLYRPASGYTAQHRYRTWRLVWMPAAKRRGALADRSLDTVTAAELEREQAQAFAMVEDLAAAASD